ncbi:hypothetical protein Pmar_PMAR011762 [Perkinsus marinus ATCC 50983]|uniref:Uncharacterized protein n=1 Tax=Perkinsus marinus (strain ATCC 50983 / TXsc) TaxID=423536 RepID=C5LCN3_PERM5|nr:hypothetical protein Pmar_PMAR011762 [Perkinsus marinus ATCC 50983]EER05716.1 hypothetical protein Pmar_PMAR011762 [Perkinsus marinus ATCC 50983]|eukprot:XP_002773900.1 hypothetical protein Pmar_PMAR011762 [Perkinsus marinus ATCC 50983]
MPNTFIKAITSDGISQGIDPLTMATIWQDANFRTTHNTYIHSMKDITNDNVMVVEYSVSGYVPGYTHTHKSSIVEVKIFNVVLFENDDAGDANTKITMGGLVPVGGKTEKFKLITSINNNISIILFTNTTTDATTDDTHADTDADAAIMMQ